MPFEIDHEDETAKILSDQSYYNEIDEDFGINKFQLEALRLLSTDDKHKMTKQQKELVQKFILEAMGDLKLNKKLKAIQAMSLKDTGLNGGIIGNIIYFSFKTRGASAFPTIFDKVNKNQNRIDNAMDLNEQHRISLKEYSIFTDMVKLKQSFDFFKKKTGFAEATPLGLLHQQITKAENLNQQMEKAYSQITNASPGKIVFDDTKKKSAVLGKALSGLENIIRKVITKHGHVSKLYENRNKEATLSHINPGPLEEKFTLRDYLYSNVYQIKIEKLISKDNQKLLQQMYGDKWLEIINKKYSRVERQIHDDTLQRFNKLSAQSTKEQYKAGASSLLPLSMGHKRVTKTDFVKIHKKMMEGYYTHNAGKLLCSEFVAVTTIATIMELNNKILADAAFKNVEFSKDVIKLPISKHENLHRMHPDRLLSVLKIKGCIEKVAQPPDVGKYFKIT